MSLFFVSDLTVLKDVRVSNSDYRVYSCLVSYMNKETGICYPRHATISKAIGMSRTAIYRSIKHLAKLGYVTVKRRSSTNEYYLSQQLNLQETRKKSIMFHQRASDVSKTTDINKTNNINQYSSRYHNRHITRTPQLGNPINRIYFEGEYYKECGREGNYIEYSNNKGKKIKKHTFKKEPILKL